MQRTLDQINDNGLEKARRFVEGVIAAGKPWTDPDFPP